MIEASPEAELEALELLWLEASEFLTTIYSSRTQFAWQVTYWSSGHTPSIPTTSQSLALTVLSEEY
jgi:hypothetical protein